MKAAGSKVVLRATAWIGSLPRPGDWLRTKTGRQYEILEIRGRACPLTLVCMVLPAGATREKETVHHWAWNWKRRRIK